MGGRESMGATTSHDWDGSYRTGGYRKWDAGMPSQDLVGFLAALGPGAGRAALDLGCGSGWDVLALASAGYRAVGLDVSSEAVAIASARAAEYGFDARFLVGDVCAPPGPTSGFDLLTDRGCFHHLGTEDRERYAFQAARLLRNGGMLFIRGESAGGFCNPITSGAIRQHFTEDFDIGPVLSFSLGRDDVGYPSVACALRRVARS